MPDWFHVILLAANVLILSAAAVLYFRTRYQARLARGSANYAREARADAKRAADEAKAVAKSFEPKVLQFPRLGEP